jgi:hypothetical protein
MVAQKMLLLFRLNQLLTAEEKTDVLGAHPLVTFILPLNLICMDRLALKQYWPNE